MASKCKKCGEPVLSDEVDMVVIDNLLFHKNCFKCLTCHKKMSAAGCFRLADDCYCTDCARALNLNLGCIYCKGPCWEKSHQLKLKDEIERKTKLVKPLKKKTFLPKTKNESNKNLTMENADNGVGALYIIMDTIRRKRAEQKEQELKQKSEESFHNQVNKGRELLRPLP